MTMEIINFSPSIIESDIELSLGYIIFNNISVKREHSSFLDEYISKISNQIKDAYSLENIKDNEIIRKYRDFYWHYLKIDPTKIRPSAEALIRRILGDKTIPQILNVVDAYNWVSIETLIPMGAYDYDELKFPLTLRYAKEGEEFIPIGGKVKILKGDEIILADNAEKIMFQYPYRDADFSKVTTKTINVLLISCGVPGISTKLLEKSLKKFQFIMEKMSETQFSSSDILILKK
jgi:DNA/RNA-binding domain of Phe-tRNA-synthetase-like protein